jgi:hypothetical protein
MNASTALPLEHDQSNSPARRTRDEGMSSSGGMRISALRWPASKRFEGSVIPRHLRVDG